MNGLTLAGVQWAMLNAERSTVARLALLVYAGGGQDWPQAHRDTAVKVANDEGAKVAA